MHVQADYPRRWRGARLLDGNTLRQFLLAQKQGFREFHFAIYAFHDVRRQELLPPAGRR